MDFKKAILTAITLAKTEQTHPYYSKVVDLAAEYLAHITGEGIEDYLKQYVIRESDAMFEQRKALTNSINPAVANSLMKPFYKVSRNNNVAKDYDFKDEKINKKVAVMLNDFNSDKIDNIAGFEIWLRTRFVELTFADPNGFVVLEWDSVGLKETIRPRPFEVSSRDALNFEYKGSELQWLFVKNDIKFYKMDGDQVTTADGSKYTLYSIGHTVTIEEVDKLYREASGLVLGKNQTYEEWNNRVFLLSYFNTNLGFVPAFRIGYARDLATAGKTFLNPFNPALPYFRKSLKATSELDLTMTGHVFPQKLQYVKACEGASPTESCHDGKNQNGGTCTACDGTGFKTITSAQEVIYMKLPEMKDEMIPLNDILVYKSPPIELVEFQNKYVKELKQEAHLAVYNSNMFAVNEIQFAKTATEIDTNLEGVYDTLAPYAEKFSKVWRLVVYTCAVLSGQDETKDNFNLLHQFPADPKLKTMTLLLSDMQKINDTGAPSFVRDVINSDIAEIVYTGDEDGLLKYRVRHDFFPFNGKTTDEITMLLGSQYVLEDKKILYSNFESIFTDIESKLPKFYLMSKADQEAIVKEYVQAYRDLIIKPDPFAVNFTDTKTPGGENSEDKGEDDGNTNEV